MAHIIFVALDRLIKKVRLQAQLIEFNLGEHHAFLLLQLLEATESLKILSVMILAEIMWLGTIPFAVIIKQIMNAKCALFVIAVYSCKKLVSCPERDS